MKRNQDFVNIAVIANGEFIEQLDLPLGKGAVTFGQSASATISLPGFDLPRKIRLFNLTKKGVKLNLRTLFQGTISIDRDFHEITTLLFPKLEEGTEISKMHEVTKEVNLTIEDQAFFTFHGLTILIKFTKVRKDILEDMTLGKLFQQVGNATLYEHPFTWVSFLAIALVLSAFAALITFQKNVHDARPHYFNEFDAFARAHLIHPAKYQPVIEASKSKIDGKEIHDIVLANEHALIRTETNIHAIPPEASMTYIDRNRAHIRNWLQTKDSLKIENIQNQLAQNYVNNKKKQQFTFSFPTNRELTNDYFYNHMYEHFFRYRKAQQLKRAEKVHSFAVFKSQYTTKTDIKVDKVLDALAQAVGGKRGSESQLQAEKTQVKMQKIRSPHILPIIDELNILRQKNRFITNQWEDNRVYLTSSNPYIITRKKGKNLRTNFNLRSFMSNYKRKINRNKPLALRSKKKKKRSKSNNPAYIDNFLVKKKRELGDCLRVLRRAKQRTASIGLIVDRFGDPIDIAVEKSSYNSKNVSRCLIRKISKWKFPIGEDGPIYVSFNIDN